MFCRRCGNKINDGATFCQYCGAAQPQAQRTVYCRNCGKAIHEQAVVCPHCGVITNAQTNHSAPIEQRPTNSYALAGLILSFFCSIAGLICSIIGLQKAKEMNGEGHGLALAGLIISICSMVLGVLACIFIFEFFPFIFPCHY